MLGNTESYRHFCLRFSHFFQNQTQFLSRVGFLQEVGNNDYPPVLSEKHFSGMYSFSLISFGTHRLNDRTPQWSDLSRSKASLSRVLTHKASCTGHTACKRLSKYRNGADDSEHHGAKYRGPLTRRCFPIAPHSSHPRCSRVNVEGGNPQLSF